jgi:hypothetical protein
MGENKRTAYKISGVARELSISTEEWPIRRCEDLA